MNNLRKVWFRFSAIQFAVITFSIVCWALGMRLLGLTKGIWLDEYASIALAFHEDFFRDQRIFDHPPLYFFLLRVWSSFNTSEAFLRLPSVAFGIGTLIVLMQWVRRYSWFGSVLVGIVGATLPMMLRYSQEIRQYSLLLLATALAFWFASLLVEQPVTAAPYVGMALSFMLAVSTHLVGVMVIPSVLVFIALQIERQQVRWRMTLAVVVTPVVVFSMVYVVLLRHIRGGTTSWIPQVSLSFVRTTMELLFGVDILRMFQAEVQQRSGGVEWLAYLLPVLGILLGIGILLGNWRRGFPLLTAALVFWTQTIVYSLVASPIFMYRTVLPGLVPMLAFVAVQIATARFRPAKIAASAVLVVVSLVFAISWTTSHAWMPYESWRQLTEAVRAARTEEQLVVFYPQYVVGPVKYYYPALPDEAILSLDKRLENNEIEQIATRVQSTHASGIILVVRSDATVAQYSQQYEQLRTRLEARFGPPLAKQEWGLLSLTCYP